MSTIENASHAKTASTRVIETETGIHDLTITNFSFGEVISDENVGLKSILLMPKKTAFGAKARSTISILDQNQNISKHSFTIEPEIINSKYYGEKKIVSRKELEMSKCLVNDCLTIRCTLTVVTSSYIQNTKQCWGTFLPLSEMYIHLGNLLDSGEGTDVTFDVDGEIFHARKIVLTAQSPIFKAELFGPMKEAKYQILLP
ncbi:BTB/POZ and MATH domain-containing 2 -like protein [Carex littledalei]|uniref:BTB/POZ and MATH domain-containing 2 -like protein n=1 Tax=Carex littledalei TaxID=544730 RepID=A0A833VIZ8_9POAL|nr:BTB/POZ and MATH domain-containing 2 -like protein [Carex littledalei]